jgi:hypothetical protein
MMAIRRAELSVTRYLSSISYLRKDRCRCCHSLEGHWALSHFGMHYSWSSRGPFVEVDGEGIFWGRVALEANVDRLQRIGIGDVRVRPPRDRRHQSERVLCQSGILRLLDSASPC